MTTLNFNKWNTLLGWFAFAVALLTFSLTVEPTVSFWDCGEYISTSAKLQVGHPPGAPLFQMIGAFFAMFAPDDSKVALMVNMMSVFSSAFTILFMYWSSTLLLRKIITRFKEITKMDEIAILGASLVGALAFTFTDSFWYNAVEAEVYAMATLLISLLFWLGLRWETDMHTPRGNKWLLLICLVLGLSFGVHFMALLAVPSIGLLYFFKNYKTVTVKNFIIANIVVVAILLFIFKMLLPLTMSLFGKTEVFMVNTFGLPFNSGTIFMTLFLIAFFYFGLKFTRTKNLPQYNTILLCILFVLIGFSTWMMLPIRANANVVINENRPSDAREVLAYYNREQYPQNPLFYGPQFTDMFAGLDPDEPFLDKAPNYERDYKTGKYVITNNFINATQNSHNAHKAFLPRMWNGESAQNYMEFTNVVDFKIDPEYAHEQELVDIVSQFRQAYSSGRLDTEDYISFLKGYGNYLIVEKPKASDNFRFMFEYQFGYMYVRYLMWNFVGRQSDVQGKYDNEGNWLSGIDFIDEIFLGSQKNLPEDVITNKGRNVYFFLPFILGIIGLLYHSKKDLKSFYVLLALFLFTGIALKIYLNERPFEPRERDYALVGSFYVFAIWIGIGVYAIFDTLIKWMQPKIVFPFVFVASLLAAPVLLASQNWDDHDRSGKYTALANAKGYLESCEPNAILFTIGDNDTFPLWYAQEIEGIRRDVRVVNTQLFMTDWHIDQMKAKAYTSEPLPISFDRSLYVGDKLDYCVYNEITQNRWELKDFINFIKSDDPNTKLEMQSGQSVHFFPTNKIRYTIDKEAVIKNKVVSEKYYDSIVPFMDIDIKDRAIYKARIMMFDIIQNNNWERPIYFTGGSDSDEDFLWMKQYLQLDGLVYKLVPIKTPYNPENGQLEMGMIDSDKMYDIVMKWDWGNSDGDIYHDIETRRNSITYRLNLSRLMQQLIAEGKTEKAKEVIDLVLTKLPLDKYGFYTLLEPFVAGYYDVGETKKAQELMTRLAEKYNDNLNYYVSQKASEQNDNIYEVVKNLERYRSLIQVIKSKKDTAFYEKNRKTFNSYNKRFERFGRDNE
ncbi:MAG TPA: DUF2723 domain-containing protein [Flavobacterium sp.]|uniref:DUF2723 domain-containing protein n=1 Tax=unclassified Flavobacterium TaxID=196869 RepID=UPI0025C16E4C|nr:MULTISPECIES: DUF2723 domain-containing protein [unclassified Flavobacterium]HRE76243.1 DUF2723 domain-containing protein [Flavobacterium sp.]